MISVLAISRMSPGQSGSIAILERDGPIEPKANAIAVEASRCRNPGPEAAKATGELPPAKTRGKLFPTATH